MDESASPPDSGDHFTQVLHGQPTAAIVTNTQTGQSVPLQEAIDEGRVQIGGEIEQQQGYGVIYVGSDSYDEVEIRNTSNEPLRIEFNQAVVLGGADQEPFPFDASLSVRDKQGETWDAVEEQQQEQERLAAALEAEKEAQRQIEHQRILSAQEGLIAAGYAVPLDGEMGESTRLAIRQFERRSGFKESGEFNERMSAKLDDSRRAIKTWLTSVVGYYRNNTAPTEIGDLKRAIGIEPTAVLTSSAKKLVVATLQPKFDHARGTLEALGYRPPSDADPVQWMHTVTAFQDDWGLTSARAGTLDETTVAYLDGFAAAMENTEYLTPDAVPLSNTARRTLNTPGDPVAAQFFRVETRLARAIARILNDAVGSDVIRQQTIGDDSSSVILVVADTREFLRSAVRDILDTSRVGLRIAMDKGVAFRQIALDTTALVVSAGTETQIDVLQPKVDTAISKIWNLLRHPSPEAEQRKQVASLIRERVRDAEVAIITGHELDAVDVERIVRVPVIRSAIAGRSPQEIKARFQQASTRTLDLKKTVVLSGLPTNAKEFRALEAHDLRGSESLWISTSREINDYFHGLHVPVRTSSHRSLNNAADVIVVFAHSRDGTKVLFPSGGKVYELSAADLARSSAGFEGRKPTILLMSCSTGDLGQSSPALAQELIRLGAGAVIAPKAPIDVRNARDFIDAILSQDPAKSLVDRIGTVLRDPRFNDGNIRFIVHRANGVDEFEGEANS